MDHILIKEHGRERCFWVCFGVLAAFLVTLLAAIYVSRLSHTVNETRFRLVSMHSSGLEMVDRGGNTLTMTVLSDSGFYNPFLSSQEFVIYYLDRTITLTREGLFSEPVYVFSDGFTWTGQPMDLVIINGEMIAVHTPESELHQEERDLMIRIQDYYFGYIAAGEYIIYAFWGLVILLLGLALFFYPEVFWELRTFLSVRNGEPTDIAIFLEKTIGVILVSMVYIGLIMFFV